MRAMRTTSILVAGLALAAGTVAAQAQQSMSPSGSPSGQGIGQHAAARGATSEEPKVKANDKAYNAALKNLPDKPYDPWRNVR